MITINQLSPDIFSRWDEFVAKSAEATFFHRAGWKTVLENAFGHRGYFLYAERDRKIEGILPLGHNKSALFGNVLVSTPFCVYGGIVAENQEAASALRQAACDLAHSLKVDALELRNLKPSNEGWAEKNLYSTFRKSIDADPEVNMKAIPRQAADYGEKGDKKWVGE